VPRNHFNDAIERKLAIRPDPAVNIPSHHPDGRFWTEVQA
jgi:hypothetical protein